MGTVARDSEAKAPRYGRVPQKAALAGIPLLFEDEGLEMGEAELHKQVTDIIYYGLDFHFSREGRFRVFSDLNLYYDPQDPIAYVSPDVMVVELHEPVPLIGERRSYQVGRDGPAPLLTTEVLSFRTFQQGDLSYKPEVYGRIGVQEYIVVDVTGEYLPEKLLLKRLQSDGTYQDEQDSDGGITSRLGFRLMIDADGQLRMVDAATGKTYRRPREAQAEAEALAERLRILQGEIERLRKNP